MVPDAVEPLKLLIERDDGSVVRQETFEESVFFDAKARVKKIGLNRNNPQIEGYIDVLANDSPAGKDEAPIPSRPLPRLILLTTSDTKVTAGITELAKRTGSGVAVYQSVVCDYPRGKPGKSDLVMGRAIQLNPTVYTGRPEPVRVIRRRPGTL